MKKSIFITGATGLIGTYLLKEMIENKNVDRIFLLCRKQNDDTGLLRMYSLER
ncbi:MAG: Male sterility protein [Firmicutes bacterium]|nr:Male sterility protein [Bacillota bacterium]